MIKYIFSDIDGVLTDGTVLLDAENNEQKKICYRDLDSINFGKAHGLEFALITGEDSKLARQISKRFRTINNSYGAKDKAQALLDLQKKLQLEIDEICYIGDSMRDIPAIQLAKLGVAPADALKNVRENADYITEVCGGQGVLWETVEMIVEYNKGICLEKGLKK